MTEFNLGKFKFDPEEISYHPGNACWMAHFAVAAYNRFKNANNQNGEEGIKNYLNNRVQKNNKFQSVKSFAKDDAEAILVEHPKFIVIAFRGTEKRFSDIWTFGSSKLIEVKEGEFVGGFREGFYRAVEKLWDRIQSDLKKLQNKPLWFTGHSMGGSMASIAAVRQTEGYQNTKEFGNFKGIYTFGQAASMDQDTANHLNDLVENKHFFRFHNHKDHIPLISPESPFCHMGNGIYIDENKKLHYENSSTLDLWFNTEESKGITKIIIKIRMKLYNIAHVASWGKGHDRMLYIHAIKKWYNKLPE